MSKQLTEEPRRHPEKICQQVDGRPSRLGELGNRLESRGRPLTFMIGLPWRERCSRRRRDIVSKAGGLLTRRRVWFVDHHGAVPSKDGRGGRHLWLAKRLRQHGWDASLIVASTTHPAGAQRLHGFRRNTLTSEEGVPALWIKTNAYGYSTLLRVLGMANFAANLVLPGSTRRLQAPDVVVGSTVHPLAAWAGWRLARQRKVPFVFEIRDVWPETLVDLGAVRRGGLAERTLRRLSVRLASEAEAVISPLPFVDKWLEDNGLGGKPFSWISNGADVDAFEAQMVSAADEPFTFMYLGAHGTANNLELILDAFNTACEARPSLPMRLRLVGDGPKKAELREHAMALPHGDRIFFEERIPSTEVPRRSAEADALVAVLRDEEVYRYGISLNKLFSYMAAGKPVVWSSSAPNNPIRDAGAGICPPADDVDALSSAMVEMAETSKERRDKMGKRGREHVKNYYSFEALGKKLARTLDRVVS